MRTEGTPKGESRKLKSRDKKIRDRLFSCRENWQRSNFLPPGQEILPTTGQSADWIRENEARRCRLVPMEVFA